MSERSTNNRKGNKIKCLRDQWEIKVNVTGLCCAELSKICLMGSKFLIAISMRSSFILSAMVNGIPLWFLNGQTRHENSPSILHEKDTTIPYLLEYSKIKWHIPHSNGHCHKCQMASAINHIQSVWKTFELQQQATKEKGQKNPSI